jgi:hypothetical protein
MKDIYLETPAQHIAYIKFIFESYEEVGMIRTVDRKKSIIVLLAMDDFLDTAREILESLKCEVPLLEVPRPAELADDWLMAEILQPVNGSRQPVASAQAETPADVNVQKTLDIP